MMRTTISVDVRDADIAALLLHGTVSRTSTVLLTVAGDDHHLTLTFDSPEQVDRLIEQLQMPLQLWRQRSLQDATLHAVGEL